jgi:hypothetical protein
VNGRQEGHVPPRPRAGDDNTMGAATVGAPVTWFEVNASDAQVDLDPQGDVVGLLKST